MTTDHWLAIAQIISSLTVPAIQWAVQSRKKPPTATPETNQPNNLIQRINQAFTPFALSPWKLPSIIVLFNAASLVFAIRGSANPPSRFDVLFICLGVMGIWWGLMLVGVNLLWKAIDVNVEFTAKTSQDTQKMIQVIIDHTERVLRLLEQMAEQPESATQDRQRFSERLLAALKTLING